MKESRPTFPICPAPGRCQGPIAGPGTGWPLGSAPQSFRLSGTQSTPGRATPPVVAKYCARVPETETGPTRFGRQGSPGSVSAAQVPGTDGMAHGSLQECAHRLAKKAWSRVSPLRFPESAHHAHTHITDYKTAWRTAARKAGLRDRRIYDLRASFASRANNCNASGLTVAHLLGHDSTQIWPTYVKALDENTRAVIGALEAARNSHQLHWKSIQ